MKERQPSAFTIEYETSSTDEGLYDNIVSYLGEYRLQVQKYSYKLKFGGSSLNDLHLRDIDGEPMVIKVRRAIAEKKKKGMPNHREGAELEAIDRLDYELIFAKGGNTVIWGSPPGPKEEGYGDYGFIFTGRITKRSLLDADLDMTAIRVEHPTLAQYNRALTELSLENLAFIHEEDILRHPFVRRGALEEADVDTILYRNFLFTERENDQKIFKKIIAQLAPSIREFMRFVRIGTKSEKLTAFYAIENYALELKERFRRGNNENILYMNDYRSISHLGDLIPLYGFEPPGVSGSCGVTGDTESNNPFANGYDILRKALGLDDEDEEWFTCPKCHYSADGPVGNECPKCHLTKEQAKEMGLVICA